VARIRSDALVLVGVRLTGENSAPGLLPPAGPPTAACPATRGRAGTRPPRQCLNSGELFQANWSIIKKTYIHGCIIRRADYIKAVKVYYNLNFTARPPTT